MAYIFRKPNKSVLTSVKTYEGETIEQKIERIIQNKEPIKDGAPEIFTERKDGVIAAYNIRADRWEIAADAMDAVQRSIQAKREERAKAASEGDKNKASKETKVVQMNQENTVQSTQGQGPVADTI